MPACLGSGESSLPSHGVHVEEERASSLGSLPRVLTLSQGPPLMTSFDPNYLLKAPPPNATTLGVRTSMYEF